MSYPVESKFDFTQLLEAAVLPEMPAIHTFEIELVDGNTITLSTACDEPMLTWKAYGEIALRADSEGYAGQYVAINHIRSEQPR